MPAEERVLCFERKLLDDLGLFQGLSLEVGKYMAVVAARANVTYLNRRDAEQNKRYKQLIPYVIIVKKDRVLRYQRGLKGGENRLHGLRSIGIGGHISEEDNGLFSQSTLGYYEGMRREVKEEVNIDVGDETAVALINDDSTDVGSVHFGVVHVVKVTDDTIARPRKGKEGVATPLFTPVADAVKDLAAYESWSRFCLERIDLLLATAS
jgi:predicted NUDIX family phosphoesterase